jgi:plastocyanin
LAAVGKKRLPRSGLKWAAVLAPTLLLAACVPSTETSTSTPPVSASPPVTIQDMRFNSDHVTIEEGDTVTWVWDDDGMTHDVSGDGFRSEIQSEGTFSHTFEDSGAYPYVCSLHSGMRGTVTVVDSA